MERVEGDRLNKEPPNLSFRRKDNGGINFTSTVANTHLDLETMKATCSEYRIHNADINLSAHLEWNLDGQLEKIWEYLDLTRKYTKPKGMNPDYEDPVILSSKKRTVEDFCNRIHKDMLKQFK